MTLAAIGSAAVIALGVDAVMAGGAGHAGYDSVHHFAGCGRTAAVKARGACVTRSAISCRGRNMPVSFSLRTAGALTDIGAVVAGVAAAGADHRVVHGVGGEARRRVDVAAAALNPGHRDVRRGLQTGCRGAVVAARAVGVGGCVGKGAARPTGEGGGRGGVTADAVLAAGGDVTGE